MKIKTIDVIGIFNILSQVQANQLRPELADTLTDNILTMLPVVKEFEAAQNAARSQSEDITLLQQAVQKAADKEVELNIKTITQSELKEIAKSVKEWRLGWYGVFDKIVAK